MSNGFASNLPSSVGAVEARGTCAPAVCPTDGAASFQHRSCDRKLSPVQQVHVGKRRRLIPLGPYVCSTYTSIAATCSDECPHKSGGCYDYSGPAGYWARKRDEAARGHSAIDVIIEEVNKIDAAFPYGVPQDGARGGRDLRLHVGGDVGTVLGAGLLAEAARRWRARGGGTVWVYTHNWREVPRSAWGPAITVFASVERAQDIEIARGAGYPSAILVPEFPSTRAFRLPGTTAKIVPCPAETNSDANRSVTCATCRLCLDRNLHGMNVAIGFEPHGPGARQVREHLLRQAKQGLVQIGRDPGASSTVESTATGAGNHGVDASVRPANSQEASRSDDAESYIRRRAHLTGALQLLEQDVRLPLVPTCDLPQVSAQLPRIIREPRSRPWTKSDLELVESLFGPRRRPAPALPDGESEVRR